MKKIFYIVRYSVFNHSNAWNLSKELVNVEDYKAALFEKRRLDLKFELFSKLTLPSVTTQVREESDCNYEVIVLTSDELPTKHMNDLVSLKQDMPFTILPVERNQNYARVCSQYIHEQFAEAGTDRVYATVRLDDDDILANNYEARLRKYLHSLNFDYIVTFPLGLESYIVSSTDGYRVENTLDINFKKIALGLAHIGFYRSSENSFKSKTIHIYQTGNHTKVDERFNVIYDMTPKVYLRVSYDMQDTKGVGYRKRLSQARSVPPEEVKQAFPLFAQYM
ncbi:glycosyltransferase [Alteromonas genovensis]|uniref:glycosyltransferase n=1 Tax=Alteromonas genovensis TaxID=471225 RepID=UPI002FE1923C